MFDFTAPTAQGLVLNIDPNTGAILDHPATGATKLAVSPEHRLHWQRDPHGNRVARLTFKAG